MLKFIRQYWKISFICFLIFAVIVSAVLTALTPKTVTVVQSPTYTQTNNYGQQTTFQNISFSGTTIPIPPQMTVAKMAVLPTTENTFVFQLETDYQLTASTLTTNIWIGPNYALARSDTLDYYDFTSNKVASSTGKVVDKDLAIAAAQKLLNSYIPNNQLQVVSNNIGYFQADYEPTNTAADKADWVYLPFTYLVDGYPVFYQNQREIPFGFFMDANQRIQKFSFYPFFISLTAVQKTATISISQAIKNINAGKASLISMRSSDQSVTDISQITSANLIAVSLEYREDNASLLVYPFFRFSGTATNAQGSPIAVEIITPAIVTTSK